MRRTIVAATVVALTGFSTLAAGQTMAAAAASRTDAGVTAQPPALPTPQAVHPGPRVQSLKRWLDLSAAQTEVRYRYLEASTGAAVNQMQHKQALKLGLKFDAAGRYSLQAGFGTGNSITGSWDNLGPGAGVPTWDFSMRLFYAAAEPVKGLQGQLGGLAPIRGESTEITTYDNDAYLVGERIDVKRPDALYLDEVAVTVGYLGDLFTPNVLRRLDRLGDHNFTQVLGARRFGAARVSADWTSAQGVSTLHQAVYVSSRRLLPVVESVRFEQYERTDQIPAYGLALSGERHLGRRTQVALGYGDVDRHHSLLTGDRYGRGQRLFTEGRVTLLPELTASLFYTRAFGHDFPLINQQRLDVILSYNILKALQTHGLW